MLEQGWYLSRVQRHAILKSKSWHSVEVAFWQIGPHNGADPALIVQPQASSSGGFGPLPRAAGVFESLATVFSLSAAEVHDA